MERRTQTRRLGRSDWIAIALEVIAADGIAAVAVEPLAERLNVTKGSFYWHFGGRSDLILAALDEWAVRRTRRRIAELDAIEDPHERLERLMTGSGPSIDPMDTQLIASLGDPMVVGALERHHRLWIDFATRVFRDLGFRPAEAEARAVVAYSVYLGLVVLSNDRQLPARAGEIGQLAFGLVTSPLDGR